MEKVQLDKTMSTLLSAVIITKNEEKRIEKCLNSIKDWVDEIVIIDDLSTDNTVEICKKFTDKVFINDSGGWLDYVNRNLGIEKASGKWILSLDADEIIPPSTKEKILEIIRSDAPYVAYKFLRKNFF
ncbi:MAG: glycosyltransferase family 2 protein [Thermodesulfobacterium sp.]|nr:glycosyltransferase family 2 protein [Thermodesulfobacterium sp.]